MVKQQFVIFESDLYQAAFRRACFSLPKQGISPDEVLWLFKLDGETEPSLEGIVFLPDVVPPMPITPSPCALS